MDFTHLLNGSKSMFAENAKCTRLDHLQRPDESGIPTAVAHTITKTPSKTRSPSDSTLIPTPTLDPSPKFKEPPQRLRDDDDLVQTPSKAPRRLDLSARGLSLQIAPGTNRGLFASQGDYRESYGSPSTALPRHSRGMDFSRACTNLHHSTVVDQSSPDSSPTVTQKGLKIPSRRNSMMLDSPRMGSGWGGSGNVAGDRPFFARSVGSITALPSDTSNSSSEDDDMSMRQDDPEDNILTTPQVRKFDNASAVTPFGVPRESKLDSWSSHSRMVPSFRRSQFSSNQSGNSSDSFDGHSGVKHEDSTTTVGEAFFAGDVTMSSPISRRESLSLGTNGLHISTSNESGDEWGPAVTPMTPGVVRRPVTRRSNLLPKTKGFARIRAALQEESTPVDSDAKREAEVVRQVQDSYERRHRVSTAPSSPDFLPSIPGIPIEYSDNFDTAALGFSANAQTAIPDLRRASSNKEFLPYLYNRTQTPPPPLFNRARSSSGLGEDVSMASPDVCTPPSSVFFTLATTYPDKKADVENPVSTSFQQPRMPSPAEVSRKVNKRRRDEDFDIGSIKRRAVSPAMSAQSSPTVGQSSGSNSVNSWGLNKFHRDGSVGSAEDKSGNNGQVTPGSGPKRVGLQGMTDTHDGLMKMSIE